MHHPSPFQLKGEVLHGVMHALGVLHEHNRIDRDDHLVAQWSRLSRDALDFFVLDRPQFVSTFGTWFDFGTIMMYSPSVCVLYSLSVVTGVKCDDESAYFCLRLVSQMLTIEASFERMHPKSIRRSVNTNASRVSMRTYCVARMFCCSQGTFFDRLPLLLRNNECSSDGCSDHGDGLCGYFVTRAVCSSKWSWAWMLRLCLSQVLQARLRTV